MEAIEIKFTRTPIIIFHSQYNGVWYRYISLDKEKDWMSGMWELSDTQSGIGAVISFNADTDRIDQCFEQWGCEYEQALKEGYLSPEDPNYKPKVYFATIKDEAGNNIDAWDAVVPPSVSMIEEMKPWIDKCSDAYLKMQSMVGVPESRQGNPAAGTPVTVTIKKENHSSQ